MDENTLQTPIHFDQERDHSLVRQFLEFNDASKSPFHAVHEMAVTLSKHGYTQIAETDDWNRRILPGGRYFTTRNGTSIVAFAVGKTVSKHADSNGKKEDGVGNSQEACFSIVAAHTDSPCFKVKPLSASVAHGYIQLGVECYGGGLWHTWFDRDLTVAGRVIVKKPNGKHSAELVEIHRPILRIPNLAIHLSRNVATDGFKVNKETDTTPILATLLADALNSSPHSESPVMSESSVKPAPAAVKHDQLRHAPLLLMVLAKELAVDPAAIVDVDLCVADTQPGAIGGALEEFVFAPRLDNLASCFSAMKALVDISNNDNAMEDDVIRVVACFDHEEVGSRSAVGADSSLLPAMLRRISNALGVDFDRAMARSLVVSADMAHAVHPNYATKHEARHRPRLGAGIVVKTNQNQRYATNGVSGWLVREAARRAGHVCVQEFVVPNDKPCGSTVGPALAAQTGVLTVDVGQPQLAMHSIREMASVHDFWQVVQVLTMLLGSHVDIVGDLAIDVVTG